MKVYNYDPETGEYMGVGQADESPREPGAYLIPAHATEKEPPAGKTDHARVFRDDAWVLIEDHRGETRYDTDGNAVEIKAIGPVDPALTQEPPAIPESARPPMIERLKTMLLNGMHA